MSQFYQVLIDIEDAFLQQQVLALLEKHPAFALHTGRSENNFFDILIADAQAPLPKGGYFEELTPAEPMQPFRLDSFTKQAYPAPPIVFVQGVAGFTNSPAEQANTLMVCNKDFDFFQADAQALQWLLLNALEEDYVYCRWHYLFAQTAPPSAEGGIEKHPLN